MEVIVASRYAGFCGGVRRAWRLALEQAASGEGPVYLSGKLIHNDPAMKELEALGIRVAESLGEMTQGKGTLIMRAHGEGPLVYEHAARAGLRVVDATCNIVKAVQRRARALEEQGYQIVLFGHRRHPEAMATVAFTQRGLIVESVEEARQLGHRDRIAALAQTTAPRWEYEEVCEVLRSRCDVFADQGRICGWTLSAQEEAEAIARQVEAMVIVGGRESSNTRRLVEVCARHCPSYQVETADEIDSAWVLGRERVGLAAGASTRDEDIQAAAERLRGLGRPHEAVE